MDKFVASFPSPCPDEALVNRVQMLMRQELAPGQSVYVERGQVAGYVLALTAASVPLFLFVNYLYFLLLQSLGTLLAPPIAHSFVAVFLILGTLTGALCYGSIPIWTAYWLKERGGQ